MNKKNLLAKKFGVSNTQIDTDALFVIKELHKSGYDGFIVGGGIRDLILQKPPKDFDIVTNATPEEIKKIFKRQSIIIGKRFKIVHIYFNNPNFDKLVNNRPIIERHIIEVSTYRSSKKKSITNELGRIMFDNNYGNQKDDASRRDFTINALYYNPITETIIDYHNGIEDLTQKKLRMIGEPELRYIEDPVRILRVIRLSVKLDLDIEDSTYGPIKKYKYLLKNENIGRRYEEMLKILLSGYSSLCISRLKQISLPKEVFPLFDDIYFKKKPDLIALEVLKKTDDRICNEQGMVSVSFLFASILWHMIYPKWQKKLNKNYSSIEALEMAVEEQKKQFFSYGIIRNVFSAVTYIWRTQIFFENPNLDNLHNFVNSSRFRQGLHLFNLRHLDNQIDPKLYQWWNQYVEANIQEKTRLEDELKILCNITHR